MSTLVRAFRMGRELPWLALGLLCLLPLSCKKTSPEPVRVRVRGRVEVRGRTPNMPLVVTFHPADPSSQANMPSAVVSAGEFELRCLPGRYKATLTPLQANANIPPAQGGLSAPGLPVLLVNRDIPPAYLQTDSSPWEVTVPAQGVTDLVLPAK